MSFHQIEEYERSLGECRLLISQHEARCASLAESMREAENKKRQLEEAADALREECARLQVCETYSLKKKQINSALLLLTFVKPKNITCLGGMGVNLPVHIIANLTLIFSLLGT